MFLSRRRSPKPTSQAWLARAAFAGLLLLLLIGLAQAQRVRPASPAAPGRNDRSLHEATIERLGNPSADYYQVVGSELRTRGYPTASIPNWRTPFHYRLVAAVGVAGAGYFLAALALGVIGAGCFALRSRYAGSGYVAAGVLLGAMLTPLINRRGGVVFAENWAGVLIALSLAGYHLRWWTFGALAGVAAIFVRELAVPYGVTCGLLAMIHRRRTESVVWIAGGLFYTVYYLIHAVAVTHAIQTGDQAHPSFWLRFLGWPFVLQTVWLSGWTILLPSVVTPIAAVLGLAGTAAPAMPVQLRASLFVYVVFLCLVGQEFNYYWGFLTAPFWAYALVHSPEGLRVLYTSARPIRSPLSIAGHPGCIS